MESLFSSILLIVVVMLILSAITTFVFLKADVRPLVKFMLIPTTLGMSIFIPLYFTTLLGYSVPMTLPETFTLLAHRTVINGTHKVALEVWIKEKSSSRLYMTSYNRDLEKQLDEAAKGRGRGMEARMSLRNRKGNGIPNIDGSDADSPYNLQLLSPSQLIPKAPEVDETK